MREEAAARGGAGPVEGGLALAGLARQGRDGEAGRLEAAFVSRRRACGVQPQGLRDVRAAGAPGGDAVLQPVRLPARRLLHVRRADQQRHEGDGSDREPPPLLLRRLLLHLYLLLLPPLLLLLLVPLPLPPLLPLQLLLIHPGRAQMSNAHGDASKRAEQIALQRSVARGESAGGQKSVDLSTMASMKSSAGLSTAEQQEEEEVKPKKKKAKKARAAGAGGEDQATQMAQKAAAEMAAAERRKAAAAAAAAAAMQQAAAGGGGAGGGGGAAVSESENESESEDEVEAAIEGRSVTAAQVQAFYAEHSAAFLANAENDVAKVAAQWNAVGLQHVWCGGCRYPAVLLLLILLALLLLTLLAPSPPSQAQAARALRRCASTLCCDGRRGPHRGGGRGGRRAERGAAGGGVALVFLGEPARAPQPSVRSGTYIHKDPIPALPCRVWIPQVIPAAEPAVTPVLSTLGTTAQAARTWGQKASRRRSRTRTYIRIPPSRVCV